MVHWLAAVLSARLIGGAGWLWTRVIRCTGFRPALFALSGSWG